MHYLNQGHYHWEVCQMNSQVSREMDKGQRNETAQPLLAETIPLFGKHLIEASAGTGKTFNITRIYLRMLLERQASVDNILVMTFTKAATEEIRGRIDEFLREALTHWQSYTQDETNPYFYQLGQMISYEKASVLIKHALLNLDEAAIFTIHGFCKRVLSQHAFTSGISFNAQMEADDAQIMLDAVQDYYRVLAKDEECENYLTLVEFWPTPDKFIDSFQMLLRQDQGASSVSAAHLNEKLVQLAQTGLQALHSNEALLYAELIDNKSGKVKQTRIEEFEQLLAYLQRLSRVELVDATDVKAQDRQLNELINNPVDFKFVSAARFPKAAAKAEIKAQLIAASKEVNQLKSLLKDFAKLLGKANGYEQVLRAVDKIKQSIDAQKLQSNILNFDDLVSKLATALQQQGQLQNPEDKGLIKALINQYPIALIDEFQDTDPKQYAILEQLYFNSQPNELSSDLAIEDVDPQKCMTRIDKRALYLIGDPKQAIYGFRGGDIFTYLKASKMVDQQWLMDTNWRSSGAMINAYNHLFYGNDLHQEPLPVFGQGIEYKPVFPSPFAHNTQLVDDNKFSALTMVNFTPDDAFISRGSIKQDYRIEVAAWCASEISRLLATGKISTLAKLNKQDKKERVVLNAVEASDIAILVRDGREADDMKQALTQLGIASVYKSQRANLFASFIAQRFVSVLNAIINRDDDRAFVAALSGPFFGKTSAELYQLQQDEMAWENTRLTFNALFALWQRRGFMAMALKLLHDHYPGAQVDGERQLTNIIHLFELLQTASQKLKQPQELMAYLQEQCANPAQTEAELRLESDANLVQIVTLHGSKGLEYPLVFIPFATRHKDPAKFAGAYKEVLGYHNEQGEEAIFLGQDDAIREAMVNEQYAEDVRLLYVGVTRAKLRCYIGCVAFADHHKSPLGLSLKLQAKQAFKEVIEPLGQCSDSDIVYLDITDSEFSRYDIEQSQDTDLAVVANFKGRIERDWWLSSFSALTRNIRHAGKTQPDRDQEQDTQALAQGNQIRFAFAKGAKTGNFLHDLLQYTDFITPDWPHMLDRMLPKFGELPSGFRQNDVVDWLDEMLASPLNDAGLALNQLSFDATLREAQFYFPMQDVNVDQLMQLINVFRQSIGIHAKVEDSIQLFGQLKGMMHGFIDLIFADNGQYFVCDYKSSHLGDQFSDYQGDKLIEHICDNFYDLQFLIYSLALHRYLGTRLSDYQADKHFGGVYYLYLRGMTNQEPFTQSMDNEQAHSPLGVFYQALPSVLLNALDATFKGEDIDIQALDLPLLSTIANGDAPDLSKGVQGELF